MLNLLLFCKGQNSLLGTRAYNSVNKITTLCKFIIIVVIIVVIVVVNDHRVFRACNCLLESDTMQYLSTVFKIFEVFQY